MQCASQASVHTFSPSPNPQPASSRDSPLMESALVTTGFVTGLRTPLFTSDLVKTEQVQKNGAQKDGRMMLQPMLVFSLHGEEDARTVFK